MSILSKSVAGALYCFFFILGEYWWLRCCLCSGSSLKLRAHLETVLVLILVAFAVRSMVLLGSIIGPRFVFSSKK